MYKRMLVADDGSEAGSAAVDEAVKLARSDGGELRVVFVLARPDSFGHPMVNIESVRRAMRSQGEQELARAAQRARAAGVPIDTAVLDAGKGAIAATLLEEARRWGADLVVMGTHGRAGIDHFLLGSVAEALLRAATVPVLMLRVASD